jgi:hypothetical protein
MQLVCYEQSEKWPDMKIAYLVMESDDFIVCIDPSMDVDWMTAGSYPGYKNEAAFHDVLNRMALLESLPNHDLKDKIRLSYKRMLGEAIARSLSHDYVNAVKILDNARQFFDARQGELARSWYLTTSGILTIVIGLIGLLIWYTRTPIRTSIGWLAFWLVMSAVAGAAGAFLSIVMRMGKATLDSAAGKTLHQLECTSRILAGMISAVIVTLAVYSEMIFPVFRKSQHPHAFILLVALVAGASERFAPSIIDTLGKKGNSSITKESKPEHLSDDSE